APKAGLRDDQIGVVLLDDHLGGRIHVAGQDDELVMRPGRPLVVGHGHHDRPAARGVVAFAGERHGLVVPDARALLDLGAALVVRLERLLVRLGPRPPVSVRRAHAWRPYSRRRARACHSADPAAALTGVSRDGATLARGPA